MRIAFLALLGLVGTAGCGPSPVGVEGRVTLDGKPLSEAAVLFVPLEVERQKTGGLIQSGSYLIPAEDGLLPGRYRAEIIDNPPLHGPRAHHRSGTKRRAFPYRYANASPLQIEVSKHPGTGPLRYDFALTSDPP